MESGRGGPSSCRDHVAMTFSLWSVVPTGWTMVFSLLNLAPDVMHHVSRVSNRVLGLSFSERKMVASSAKSERITLWCRFGVSMVRPDSLSEDLRRWDMGLIVKLKSKHDRGSPWQTPLVTGNFLLVSPFRMMAVSVLV